MKLFCRIFILLIAIMPHMAAGQEVNTFNYNINNGLPSNHVYSVLRDSRGYLWIATDKGVARYNGYDFKVFNHTSGIANEDIWELCEDIKGRMWLSNISGEYGYIYNNKYFRFFTNKNDQTFYPTDPRAYGNGIIFVNSSISAKIWRSLCIIGDSGLYTYNLDSLFEKQFPGQKKTFWASIGSSGEILITNNNTGFYVDIYSVINAASKRPKIVPLYRINDSEYSRLLPISSNGIVGDYLITSSSYIKSRNLFALKISTGQLQRINYYKLSANENIHYLYTDLYGDTQLSVITAHHILKYKCGPDGCEYAGQVNAKQLLGNASLDANKMETLHTDPFWYNCVGTPANGFFLNFSEKDNFRKEDDINISNYHYAGGIKDSISFWWNKATTTVAKLSSRHPVQYYKLRGFDYQYKGAQYNIKDIIGIMPYSGDTFLINTGFIGCFFNSNTGSVGSPQDYTKQHVLKTSGVIVDAPDVYYATTIIGFVKRDIRTNSQSVQYFDHRNYRYGGLLYDSLNREYLAYNPDGVCVVEKSGDKVAGMLKPSNYGINKTEAMCIDNVYGNLFFKGDDNITVYDRSSNTYSRLLKNFNLSDAKLLVSHNVLIVAGRFGLLFAKIEGRGKISRVGYYPNIKNKNFSFVDDCIALGGRVILNTDMGVLSAAIPADSEMTTHDADSILQHNRLVLFNNNSVMNFKSGDTITLDQKDLHLQFDEVNPYGNGQVKYRYKWFADSVWHELNANELTLSSALRPGRYMDFILEVYDNVWISDPVTVHLYITPLWYQTAAGRQMLWAGTAVLILMFLGVIILVTRKMALRNAEKRNLRMELELRSIYAQLNPHFVFNTLTLALNMIRKEKLEEASAHISRFARLMRAYLDSSRSRFTTLAEEMENTRNYLEIQQMRFGHIFTYELALSANVTEPDKIRIPSMLLQPLVENAINHGLIPKEAGGRLKIEIGMDVSANEIYCIVDDNGIGREQSRQMNERSSVKRKSHGTGIINELIAVINKYEKFKVELMYIDKKPPLTGTIVQLKIKNESYGHL